MISSVKKKLSYREVKSLPPDHDSKWQSRDSPRAGEDWRPWSYTLGFITPAVGIEPVDYAHYITLRE